MNKINDKKQESYLLDLITDLDKVIKLTEDEQQKLQNSLAAKILAATPYIARCPHPKRTALSHLLTFIASIRCRDVFNSKKGESIESRLENILFFPGGDQNAGKACAYLLQLLSLNDHHKDIEEDQMNGKENPLSEGLKYYEEREKIVRLYEKLPEETKQAFHPFYNQVLFGSWWWDK